MNGLLRLTTILTATIIAASLTTACGGDESEPVPGIESGVTGQGASGNTGGTTDSGSSGPDSASDRNPEAPDSGISDRPGGPDQGAGAQGGDGSAADGTGSGGVSPPLPSPAR